MLCSFVYLHYETVAKYTEAELWVVPPSLNFEISLYVSVDGFRFP